MSLDMVSVCRGLPEQLQAQSEAAVEEEETGPPLGTKRQYLVVMRHGERMDEIDLSWRETSKRPWDPPLSDKGLQQVIISPPAAMQSGCAGARIPGPGVLSRCEHFSPMQASAAADKLKGFKFSRVFISPFLRYNALPCTCR